MKRVLLSLLFCLCCTASVLATEITVSSSQWFPNAYRYAGTTATLRIYYSQSFLSNTNVNVVGGAIGSGGFYKQVACTVSSNTLNCASFALQSTIDSNKPNTRFFAVLYDQSGARREALMGDAGGWIVPAAPTSTTVAQLQNAQGTGIPNPPISYLNSQQVQTLINTAVGTLSDATDTMKGRTKLSVPASDATNPIAVGINDPILNGIPSIPCGLSGQLQFNNSGVCAGTSGATVGLAQITLNNPIISTSVKDPNGNTLLGFSPTFPATNYVNITNGGPTVGVVAAGTGPNINLRLGVLGTGQYILPGLGGSGTKCLHADNNGVVTLTSQDCGVGGGGLADPGSNGFPVRTSLNFTVARSIVGTTNEIGVVSGSGVSGNPTINFAGGHTGGGAVVEANNPSVTGGLFSGPSISAPLIGGPINDTNGAPILDLTAVPSAVDYLRLSGSNTASHTVALNAEGSDPSVNIRLTTKGATGAILLSTPILGFNGLTAGFPGLKRDDTSTSFLAVTLADGTGPTGITASVFRTATGSQLTTARGLDVGSAGGIYFKSSTNPASGDWDAELSRESAGVLAVVDGSGTPTNYRDLKVRNLTLQGTGGNVISLKAPSTGTPTYTLPSGFVAGQYMKVDASGNLSFDTPSGAGDVVGEGPVTNDHVAFFDGTSGKLIKDSGLALTGTNTGDQNLFAGIAVSGQTTVTPNATNTILTFVAGSNVTFTTDNTAKTVTVAASAGGGGGLPDAGGNGILAEISSGTTAARTLTGTSNQVAITNGSGVSGNPTFSIPNAAQLNIAKITNLTAGFVKSAGDGTLSVDTSTYLTANQTINVTGDISGSGTNAITASIGSNKVLDTMFRQSGARSVVGRSAGSTGNVADITATNASDAALRELGGVIGFGQLATGAYANSSVTYGKIQNVTASKLLGRGDGGTGSPQEITLGTGLSISGATLNSAASNPAQTGLLGVVKLSATPTDAANPVAVATEDERFSAATGARVVYASKFTGDRSAQITAAASSLGGAPGTIEVEGDGTMSAQVTIPSYTKLHIAPGTTTLNTSGGVAGGGPTTAPFLLKDNTSVELDVGAVIIENSTPNCVASTCRYEIFRPWATAQSPGNQLQANNIRITGGQLKGVPSNPHDGGIAAAIPFLNCVNCGVDHVSFNGVSGYAAQFGGNFNSQKWANSFWFTDNLVTNLQSQNVAVISGENGHIERNTFRDPGRAPFAISGATNATPIQITTTIANNYTTGASITVAGVRGNTAANGSWTYTRTGSTTGTLNSSVGNGVYTGGGISAVQSGAIAVVDFEPNGAASGEKLRNNAIRDNNFDLRFPMTTAFSGISFNPTAAGLPNEGTLITGNIMMGRAASGILPVVTGATNATPIVINVPGGHELNTGDPVTIASIGGNTAANGVWFVTVVDTTHFSLDGSAGNGAYTSGGTAIKWSPDSGFTSNGIIVSQYANGVTVAHNKLFRFSQSAILAQGTKLDVNNNTIEDSGNGGASAITTNALMRSNVHDNFYSVRPGCPSCFSNVIEEGGLSVGNTYSKNLGFTYLNIQASSKVFSSESVDSNGIPTALQFPNGFTTSGNVGIGTANPLTTMQVAGGSSSFAGELGTLLVTGGTAAKRLALGVDSSSTMYSWIQSVENGASQRNLALQPEGGNVGIGTTTPATPLDVNGVVSGIVEDKGGAVFDCTAPANGGAKGDGTTDNTSAIVTCLANASGKVAFFPPGVFLSNNIDFATANTTIRGSGLNATTIKRINNATGGFAGTGVLLFLRNDNQTITDLTFDANCASPSNPSGPESFACANQSVLGATIRNAGTYTHTIERVGFKNAINYDIYPFNSGRTVIRSSRFNGSGTSVGAGFGVFVDSTAGDVDIDGSVFTGYKLSAISSNDRSGTTNGATRVINSDFIGNVIAEAGSNINSQNSGDQIIGNRISPGSNTYTAQAGIEVHSGSVAIGNVLTGFSNNWICIAVQGKFGTRSSEISNNLCNGYNIGLFMRADFNDIDNVHVFGNDFKNTTTAINIDNTGAHSYGTHISIHDNFGTSFQRYDLSAVPVYANNAAAIAGGLKVGSSYRSGGDPDVVSIVH